MRTKKFLLLLVALFSFVNLTIAQIKFRKVIGSSGYDNGMSARQTLDKGYIVVGSTSSFGAGNTDVYLVKTDSMGILMGHQAFGGINIDRGTCVRQTSDKGFIISGYTNSFGAGGYDVYLIRIDSLYNPVWTKTYGGSNWEFGNCVEQTADGGFIVCGETYSYGNGDEDYYIIKTDQNGDTLWTKTYGGSNQDIARSIIQTSDGGYIVTGTTKSMGDVNGDIFTIKLFPNGDSIWSHKFGGALADYGNDIIEKASGGYLIGGETKNFGGGNSDGILIKISAPGITDSTKTLGGSLDDNIQSVTEDASGKVSMAGTTITYGDSGGNGDIIFYTLKSDWSYYGLTTFGSPAADEGFSVEPTIDNAFIICGTTNGFNGGIDDIYLIKTDTLCLASVPENLLYTGVEEIASEKNNHLSIYPNPAKDQVIIDLQLFEGKTKIEFFDMLGKKVICKESEIAESSVLIKLEELRSGIYLIRISDDTSVKTRKIIIEQ